MKKLTTKEDISDLLYASTPSLALSAAIETGLFEMLAERPMNGEEVSRFMNIPGKRGYYWLQMLMELGILEVESQGSTDERPTLPGDRSGQGGGMSYILLGIIPWGDSTATTAVNNALQATGGDALINISVTSSLYTFVPIYNVFCYTCTTVDGIAVKFEAKKQPQ